MGNSFVDINQSKQYLNRPPLLLRREWCQVLEGIFDALGLIEEVKSTYDSRDFWCNLKRSQYQAYQAPS